MKKKNSRKGMNDLMTLLVATAIALLVGAILMISSSDIIGDGLSGAQEDSCERAIQQVCEEEDDEDDITVPASCRGLDDSVDGIDNGGIDCSE